MAKEIKTTSSKAPSSRRGKKALKRVRKAAGKATTPRSRRSEPIRQRTLDEALAAAVLAENIPVNAAAKENGFNPLTLMA